MKFGDAQQLGNLGEKTLARICAEHAIVATRTDEDRNGWDYFLEVPRREEDTDALDKARPMLRCLVQVKATRTKRRHVALRATSLKPLVDADLPAFIVLFEFVRNDLSKCYVKHVDDVLIERILRHLRRHSKPIDNGSSKTGRITVTFERSCLINATGEALAAALLSAMPCEISKYLEEKERYRRWVGYESLPMKLTFRSKRNPIIDLIEHDLGVLDEVSVERLVLRDRRFEVELEEPLVNLTQGRMRFTPREPSTNDRVSVSFIDDAGHLSFFLPATLHSSQFNTWVPLQDRRFRLQAGWFDILVCPFSESLEEEGTHDKATFSGEGFAQVRQNIDPTVTYGGELLFNLVGASHLLSIKEYLRFVISFENSGAGAIEGTLAGLADGSQMEPELNLFTSLQTILDEGDLKLSTCSLSLSMLTSQTYDISFFASIAMNRPKGSDFCTAIVPRTNGVEKTVILQNSGVWFAIGVLRLGRLNVVAMAGLELTELSVDYSANTLKGVVIESQLLLVSPMVDLVLPKRILRQGVQNYLAKSQFDLIGASILPSLESLMGDLSDLSDSLMDDLLVDI